MTMGAPRGGMERREVACQASVQRKQIDSESIQARPTNQFRINSSEADESIQNQFSVN